MKNEEITNRLDACNAALERAAFVIDGSRFQDLESGIIESTSSATTCLIEMKKNNELIVSLNKPQWIEITIKESLPPPKHWVLVYDSFNDEIYRSYYWEGQWLISNCKIDAFDHQITHWKPLPEKPKGPHHENQQN